MDIVHRKLKLKNFRGVFMRNELSGKACKMTEVNLILNLDDNTGSGTHWVCLYIKNNSCYFFDSLDSPHLSKFKIFVRGKIYTITLLKFRDQTKLYVVN